MKKYDKSLMEVWEWKDKVYYDIKELTPEQHINKIKEDAERILSNARIKLTPVSEKKEHQRAA
jgi:pyruvate-formate lyase-activating enzyme